ncbi:hypothetical protein [Chitiniphilus eburneus]|uniref:Uncharacterized protein n=1 Tax=Chitiniphilus eburneus TaxID=2571148 RepID=A0A4U0PWH4_9NEIS|nr:hypothetical protein [Chitiniphilus eburneus]TJZ72859.1 hypothetical protein FAZ21_12480 [Chitiniphilus eburneus]
MIDMAGSVGLLAPADLLPRLVARLKQDSPLAFAASELPAALPQGLLLLDATHALPDLPGLQAKIHAAGGELIDFRVLFDHPAAAEYGWMIAVGGSAQAQQLAAPWLDQWAPLPSGWLRGGGTGAGCLFGTLSQFWALQQSDVVQWLADRGPHGIAAFDPVSWQEQAGKYVPDAIQLAKDYLVVEEQAGNAPALSPASMMCRTLLASVQASSSA